jgi:hypothetical protein
VLSSRKPTSPSCRYAPCTLIAGAATTVSFRSFACSRSSVTTAPSSTGYGKRTFIAPSPGSTRSGSSVPSSIALTSSHPGSGSMSNDSSGASWIVSSIRTTARTAAGSIATSIAVLAR